MLTLRWSGGAAGQGHGGSSARAADGLEQRSFDGGGARTAERWHRGAGVGGRRGAGAGGADDGERPAGEVARVAGRGRARGRGGVRRGRRRSGRRSGRRGAGAGGADDGERCGKFRQPDGVDLCCAALVLSRFWDGLGKEKGAQLCSRTHPSRLMPPTGTNASSVPVRGMNRDNALKI